MDDHKIVRQGIREILDRMGGCNVTSEFSSGEEFLEALPIDPQPDIVLLDYSMKQLNGIDVVKALDERGVPLKVILLTQNLDEKLIASAYHFGARGFLGKNCTAAELKSAIDNVMQVGYPDAVAAMRYIRSYVPEPTEQAILLSPRERHFLNLVCDPRELTYEQIADIMKVSVKSVEAYRAVLFEKHNIRSKTGLVMFAYRNKLVDPA